MSTRGLFFSRAILYMAGAPILCGCGSLLFLLNSEKLKSVAAECDKLRGQRVALVVWAEHSTLDADPFACERTARAISLFFSGNTGKKELRGTTFIDQQDVSKLQEQLGNVGPTLPNDEIARRLKADMVLRIDLFEYTTRPPEANGLILGKVSGNIALQSASEAAAVYRSEASATFPENSRMGSLDRTDEEVLTQTLNTFGELVARKFYAHEEKYK